MSHVNNRQLADLGLLPLEGVGIESAEQIAQRKIHGAVRQILANELKLGGNALAGHVDRIIGEKVDAAIKAFLSPERMSAALSRHIKQEATDAWKREFRTETMQRTVTAEIEEEFRTKAREFIRDNIKIRADVRPEPARKIIP